jgi:hypothetical protein
VDVSSTPPARSSLLGRAASLALALPLVCVVLVGALVVGQRLTDARTDVRDTTAEHKAATAPLSSEPIEVLGIATGLVRAESLDGGWSAVYPSTWFRRAQPMRGQDFLSYEPDLDFSGNLPPPGEVRVVVQLMANFDGLDPRAYASATPKSGQVMQEGDLTIAGQPAFTNKVQLNMAQPLPWPTDTRNWFVRSPYFNDRMLVIQATPADARATDVAALVASLRFAPPVVTPVTPLSRALITAKYATLTFPVLRTDRIEAKLVTWKEYELAAASFHSGVNDPEQLVWLVLVTGEVAFPGHPPPPVAPQTAQPTRTTHPWVLFTVDAITGDGIGLSCCGTDVPPKWFDGLTDRAK